MESESASLLEELEPVCIKEGSRESLAPLIALLRERGIPAKIGDHETQLAVPTPIPFLKVPVKITSSKCIYVSRHHLDDARAIVNRLEVAEAFDRHGTQECPRCGGILVEDAEQCSFCSLSLAGAARDA